MKEKLKDDVMQKIAEDFTAVVKKHNISGAVFMLEKDGYNQLFIHNLSYEDVKNHLCFATYFNEKGAIEEIESAELENGE